MKLWCPLSQLVNEGFSPNHNFFAKNFIMHLWRLKKTIYVCLRARDEKIILYARTAARMRLQTCFLTHMRVFTHINTHLHSNTHMGRICIQSQTLRCSRGGKQLPLCRQGSLLFQLEETEHMSQVFVDVRSPYRKPTVFCWCVTCTLSPSWCGETHFL